MMPSFIPVSILIVYRQIDSGDYEVFMQKRLEDGPLGGFLEFPGGKIESGEETEAAARREFTEEVGVELEKSNSCILLKRYEYSYPDRSVCLYVHIMRVKNQDFPAGIWAQLPAIFEEKTWKGLTLEANVEILKDLTKFLYENE
jgi:mutator protein MutT